MLIREKMETIKFSPAEKEVVEYLLRYPEVLDEKQCKRSQPKPTRNHPR